MSEFRDAIALALANHRNDVGRGASVVYLDTADAILAMPELKWIRQELQVQPGMPPAVREWVQS